MIEDKSINQAALDYCNTRYPASLDAPFIAEGFRKGANWMLNQFPKKKTIRVYLAALSSGVNSLNATYAFPSIKERAKWAASVNTHYYDISFFEDEMEIDL